jgi:CRP-like cAMP-binding protein
MKRVSVGKPTKMKERCAMSSDPSSSAVKPSRKKERAAITAATIDVSAATSLSYPSNQLSHTLLFDGITPDNVEALLKCRGALLRSFAKDQTIWHAGEMPGAVGVLCRGAAQVVSIDHHGTRAIHANLSPGEPFGSTFVFSHVRYMPHSVIATEDSRVLFLKCQQIIQTCPVACKFHHRLIENMLMVLAEESLRQKYKLRIISCRTTREKLLMYLNDEAARQGAHTFSIPFNRQELADYLGVERSALSAEISKLRGEGVLMSERNLFSLRD